MRLQGDWIALSIGLLIFLGGGGVFIILVVQEWNNYVLLSELQVRGQRAMATVGRSRIVSGRYHTDIVSTYTFRIGAKTYEGLAPDALYSNGHRLPVTYLPDDPTRHKVGVVDDEHVASALQRFWIWFFVALAIGGLCIWGAVRLVSEWRSGKKDETRSELRI